MIPGVTDKNYHKQLSYPCNREIDAFDKLTLEAQFQELSQEELSAM